MESDQIVSYDNLETLDVYRIGDSNSTAHQIGSILLNKTTAPKLASLRVEASLLLACRTLKTYQDRLSVLHLYTQSEKAPLTWNQFASIMGSLPNLTSLLLEYGICRSPVEGCDPTITVKAPRLKYLRCADEVVANYMWGYFEAPLLELVMITDADINFEELFEMEDTLVASVPEPFPLLKTFALINSTIVPDDDHGSCIGLTSMAHVMKHVTQLIISHKFSSVSQREDMQSILHQMISTPDLVGHWPNLETILLQNKQSNADDSDDNEDDVSFPDAEELLQFLKGRTQILGKCWKLRMDPELAHVWKEGEPALWDYIEAESLFESVPLKSIDKVEGLPGDADLRWIAEAGYPTVY